jgi:prepilin peptidase CpaA
MSSTTIIALAIALVVTAAVTDVRDRRIPNWLTYPMVLCGLGVHAAFDGWKGLLLSLAGGLFFGGMFLLFYIVRSMGAGDVKLAAALGCVVGLSASLQILLSTALAGGILALIFVTVSGRLMITLKNTFGVFGFHARHGLQSHPEVNLDNPKAVRMPYGLAFAAGTLYWAATSLLWR